MNDTERIIYSRIPVIALAALLLMLAAILFPALLFSFHLFFSPSRTTDIILAVSIATFASVVYLWILDATSILTFRTPWLSKSIWGIAIASILSTSASIYTGSFKEVKYPYQGVWEFTYIQSSVRLNFPVVISYSEGSGTYQGFTGVQQLNSNYKFFNIRTDVPQYMSIEIADLNPEKGYIIFRRHINDQTIEFSRSLDIARDGRLIESKIITDEIIDYYIRLHGNDVPKIRLMRRN